MEREILFRGKRADNGAWETGSLVKERMSTSEERVFIADKMTGYHTPAISKTVGQYTGLTDKNGRRIFEGDIIKRGNHKYVVRWGNNCAMFVLPRTPFEVIGNIHDNPELLGGE